MIAVLFVFTGSSGIVMAGNLRLHLETLAAEQGFLIEGADLIGDEQTPALTTKNLADQINLLLAKRNISIDISLQLINPIDKPGAENVTTAVPVSMLLKVYLLLGG